MALRKISRAELAQAIGTSQPYVTKILKGNVNFTLATMTKLAHAMGATLRIHLAPKDDAVQAAETARDKAPKKAAGGHR
jgi:transcriptional regulator with XRE-family HTH domain